MSLFFTGVMPSASLLTSLVLAGDGSIRKSPFGRAWGEGSTLVLHRVQEAEVLHVYSVRAGVRPPKHLSFSHHQSLPCERDGCANPTQPGTNRATGTSSTKSPQGKNKRLPPPHLRNRSRRAWRKRRWCTPLLGISTSGCSLIRRLRLWRISSGTPAVGTLMGPYSIGLLQSL